MIQQHPAQLYKSDLRGELKSETYCCLSVFNFGNYQEISRNPFGVLQVLNEEILAPHQLVSVQIEAQTEVLILPLFGGVEYRDSKGNESFIGVEQIQLVTATEAKSFELYNPYEEERVHYLQIQFKVGNSVLDSCFQQIDFSLTNKNQLIPIFEIPKALGFIGIYEGRKEGLYSLKNSLNGVFIFVIHGAFEVENRLLESKDGLSIQKKEVIEWEALSENALLLVFEITMNQV
jgi:quercetin 2,3-dioxygenase